MAQTITAVAPSEQLVSPQPDLLDLEFNAARSQFVWVDSTGKLWLGNVDPRTGYFKPINGKGTLIDAAALTTNDLAFTFNGPEWVSTIAGEQIVYTKFVSGLPHSAATGRLATATEAADGTWTLQTLLPRAPRIGPYASQDAGDPNPRITYTDAVGTHYWRNLLDAASEAIIPGLPPSPKSVRFAQGARSLVYSTPVGAVSQTFTYDLDSQLLQQITFDDGNKDLQTVPWIWQAPEFDNVPVLMTVVENTTFRFYRKADNGNGTFGWLAFREVPMPDGAKVASPEPFTFAGKSYVFMTLNYAPNSYPSSIWLTNIDVAAPFLRKISDDTLVRARIDPEVFATTKGVYIYYNRFNPAIDAEHVFCAACSEGVFRAYTGLSD